MHGLRFLHDDLVVSKPYDATKDIIFYQTHGNLFNVPASSFAIFTPHDIHAPGLTPQGSATTAQVLKVVVKCRVSTKQP